MLSTAKQIYNIFSSYTFLYFEMSVRMYFLSSIYPLETVWEKCENFICFLRKISDSLFMSIYSINLFFLVCLSFRLQNTEECIYVDKGFVIFLFMKSIPLSIPFFVICSMPHFFLSVNEYFI